MLVTLLYTTFPIFIAFFLLLFVKNMDLDVACTTSPRQIFDSHGQVPDIIEKIKFAGDPNRDPRIMDHAAAGAAMLPVSAATGSRAMVRGSRP